VKQINFHFSTITSYLLLSKIQGHPTPLFGRLQHSIKHSLSVSTVRKCRKQCVAIAVDCVDKRLLLAQIKLLGNRYRFRLDLFGISLAKAYGQHRRVVQVEGQRASVTVHVVTNRILMSDGASRNMEEVLCIVFVRMRFHGLWQPTLPKTKS